MELHAGTALSGRSSCHFAIKKEPHGASLGKQMVQSSPGLLHMHSSNRWRTSPRGTSFPTDTLLVC